MLEKFLERTDFASYEDFYNNYVVKVPEHFNFAFDVMDALAAEKPDARALVWCDERGAEATFSFRDIAEYSSRAANVFRARGIKRGDVVMLILKRRFEYWFALLALHKIGAVAIPATHLLTVKDIVYRCNAASVDGILCTDDADVMANVDGADALLEKKLRFKGWTGRSGAGTPEEFSLLPTPCSLLPKSGGVAGVSPAEGVATDRRAGAQGEASPSWVDFNSECVSSPTSFERPAPEDSPLNSDIMLIYFTSGTTGLPKMVKHNWVYPLGHIVTAAFWHCDAPDTLHLTVADTGWAKAAWGKCYGQWLCEAAVFVYDYGKFAPRDLLRVISHYGVEVFCAPPTVYRFFIKEDLSKYDFSRLRRCCVAGESLNPEIFEVWREKTGLKLIEAYGQTELTVVAANFPWIEPKPGSMGKPAPGYHLDVVREDGSPCDVDEVGQLVIYTERGMPVGVFLGYHHDEELTKRVWKNGVYWTGDTGWRDGDGYFWFVGRADDVIKSSGYRIGPFEVESALLEHPAVLECAVTGVPDEERGAVVKATIVLVKEFQSRGLAALEALKSEIQNYVKKVTAPYKYPRLIEFVKELPKTISGKIRRVEIRQNDRRNFELSKNDGAAAPEFSSAPSARGAGVSRKAG